MGEKDYSQGAYRGVMEAERWNRWLLVFSLPVVVALFYLTVSAHFGYTPDDTYIYLQFAKNIIHGNGISFNMGEPTYGFTSPLWLFIIAAGGKIGADLLLAAKAADILLASLGLIVFYLVAYETIRDVATALCATVAFSFNAWFLRWAGTGMETSLAVVLVLAVILYCLRNEYYASIFFAALAALARPEAMILPLLIGIDLFVNSYDRRRALRTAGALALVYVAIIAPWLIVAYRTFGVIVPNTALAKTGIRIDLHGIGASAGDIGTTILATDGTAIAVMLLAGGFLFVLLSRHRERQNDNIRDARFFLFRQSLIGVGWIVVFLLVYLLADVNVISRYLLLITPFITIYAFSFLHKLVENSKVRKHVYTAAFVLTAVIMFQNQLFYRSYVRPGIELFEQGMTTCLIPIGKWFRENTLPDARILAPDIGAIGYYSDRRILDAAGLISPEFVPLIRKGNQPDSIIAKNMYRNVCRVDYLVARSRSSATPVLNDSTALIFSKPFYGLTLAVPHLTYYSVYKVRNTSSAILQ